MADPFAGFVGELFAQLPCELFNIPQMLTALAPAGIAPEVGADAIIGACPIYIFAEQTPTQAGRDKPRANRFEDVVNLGIDTSSNSHALVRRSTAASSITAAPAPALPARRSATRLATRSAAARSVASTL